MRVIPSVVFSLISYYMVGLQKTVAKFLVFLLTIFMANVFGSAICFFIAASMSVFGKRLLLLRSLPRITSCVSPSRGIDSFGFDTGHNDGF